MEEIVLFGGTFNPPHKVHQMIIDMISTGFADKLFIVPCGAYKESTKHIQKEHRVNMLNIAFKNLYHTEKIDFYDIDNNVYTPTYLVDERYKKLYPYDRIWHIVGEDNVVGGCNKMSDIHRTWDNGEEIWNNLNFIVILRPGYKTTPEDLPPNRMVYSLGEPKGCGTDIRERIKKGMPITHLVDLDIAEYIKANKLYLS